jgi:hypothetical protein
LQGEKRERLMKLAAEVAAEQDPKRFHALLVELNNLLEEKEHRLRGLVPPAPPKENPSSK